MAVRRRNSTTPSNNLMEFLKQYWYIFAGGILLYPMIVKYMRSTEANDKIAETEANKAELEAINAHPDTQASALMAITTNTTIHQVALDVFHGLGFAYSWWNPRSWSENDKVVFLAIQGVTVGGKVPNTLVQCYYVVTSGRNLRNDCLQSLDDVYFKQLRF